MELPLKMEDLTPEELEILRVLREAGSSACAQIFSLATRQLTQ